MSLSNDQQVAGCRASVSLDADPAWINVSFRIPIVGSMSARTVEGQAAASLLFEFASQVVGEILRAIPEKDAHDFVRMMRDLDYKAVATPAPAPPVGSEMVGPDGIRRVPRR